MQNTVRDSQTTKTFTVEELVGNTLQLASLPDVYTRIKDVLRDRNAGIPDVARVVEKDPGLSARVLRIANSAFFGFAAKIETISRAVNLLGTQQLHDLVLATCVVNAFEGLPEDAIDMENFWRLSVRRGVFCRLLATRCNVLDSERLFVDGLLLHLGHLIMYQQIPHLTHQALLRSRQESRLLADAERELIGLDYAQVGSELARAWNLPASLCEVMSHHLDPVAARHYPLEVSICHIADLLTQEAESNLPFEQWELLVDPHAWQVTGLTREILEPVVAEADEHFEDALDLIRPQ